MADTCLGKKTDGSACGSPAREGSDFCLWHDPDLAEEAHRQQVRGGQARRVASIIGEYPGDVTDVDSLVTFLNAIAREAWNLPEGSEKRLRCLTAVGKLFLDMIPDVVYDKRFDNLEQLILYGQPSKSTTKN